MIKVSVFIYFLFDLKTMKGYVGKSIHPEKRVGEHWMNRFKMNYYLHCWLRKFSFSPPFKILEECPQRNWERREVYWIARMKREGWKLTNITDGGKGTTFEGHTHTKEVREKISELHKGNTYLLGHRHTKETREKISVSLTGRKCSPFTEEHRRKMSLAKLGNNNARRENRRSWV